MAVGSKSGDTLGSKLRAQLGSKLNSRHASATSGNLSMCWANLSKFRTTIWFTIRIRTWIETGVRIGSELGIEI